ncbi:Lengsin Glutamate-ammonia ligase domain-containing protein 1 [Channa argus]|uniref:Lengsin n=1 Tax=Channa argus TaxID=215402 RepID=A0A6G1PCW9_CHAAH|nr:Lengsin Glutamate-ammonia ligase domain-containing protein 1 [Channa argus]
MNDSEDFKDGEGRSKDQIDGIGMSLANKKGVRVTGRYVPPVDWSSRGGGPSIVHAPTSATIPPGAPTVISIGPVPRRVVEQAVAPRTDDSSIGEDGTREASSETRVSYNEIGVPRQTMEELKNILKESPLHSIRERDSGKPGSPYTYLHMSGSTGGSGSEKADGRQNDGPRRVFSTFKPQSDLSRRGPRSRESTSIQLPSSMDSSSSFRADANTNRQPEVRANTYESSESYRETGASHTDNGNDTVKTSGNHRFFAAMEQIKQQIARENINFVRFEATDLHGVSRSKTVPVRFFHEKAVYGVPMPRSYLELTLSPKSNEVDHASTANFSSDVLLIPDLSTFRVLPWAEQTARVICDPCTVTGSPLRTSPRLIAKQLLGQLQSLGFSLHSSFTYECCVLGAPDRIGPKTLLFPATTLLSNHDLPFFQQLVDNMYCMGADIDSMASASGPGQMEIILRPEFGIAAADSAFTFRTGIKEMARKHSYIASFFTDDGLYNAGVLSHSLWDANGRRSLFHTGEKAGELSEIGRKWLAGLLTHSAALSCLMSPGLGCRSHIAKSIKDPKRMLYATCGSNDNSSSFNIKSHGGRETHIDNKLGSAMANPYIVLAATVAAGLDGIRRSLNAESGLKAPSQQKEFAIPVKLDEALEALGEDHVIRSALGEPFVQYFIAMKRFEIETQELDDERNKCLEYFI